MKCCSRKRSSSSQLASCTTAERRLTTPDGIPTFEAVLTGEVSMEPWAPKTFLDYLYLEHNEENFFFFQETEAFKALKGKTSKIPPEELLLLPGNVRSDIVHYVAEIVKTFVEENAPKQVNISAVQREKLMKEVQAALESQGYDDGVFEDAQIEVKRLMQQDSWPRFKQKMLTTNISNNGSRRRLYESIVLFAITFLALGLMLGLYAPRWYIFILIVPFYLSIEAFIAHKFSFCCRMAMRGLRDRFSRGKVIPVSCPIVKGRAKMLVRKFMLVTFTLALIATGLSFALTYIIEAGVGRKLYG